MFKVYIFNKTLMANNKQLNNLSFKKRLFFFKFIKLNSLFNTNSYLHTSISFVTKTKFFYIFKKWRLFKKKYKKYNTFKYNINKYYKHLNRFFLLKINFFLLKHNGRYLLNNVNVQQFNLHKLYLYLPLKKLIITRNKFMYYNLYKSLRFFFKQLKIRKKRYKRFKKYYRRRRLSIVKFFFKKMWYKAFLKRRTRNIKRSQNDFFNKKNLKKGLRFISFLMRRKIDITKEAKFLKPMAKKNLKYVLKKNITLKQNLTNFILKKPKLGFFFKKNLFILKFVFNSYNYKTFLWRIIT